MRAVFMGTPTLSATILDALCEAHDVVKVFTRPDAVRGRGKKLVASPVKECALARGIEVFETKSLASSEAFEAVASCEPDVICVAACSMMLPAEILAIPRFGCLNVHTSLLPRWRGAAPIERAILACDELTGVCIMKMEEGLDTGPYCIRRETPVGNANVAELSLKLADMGSGALIEALSLVEAGQAIWISQSETGITYAEKVGKRELDCNLEDAADAIAAKSRASSASHPCRLHVANRTVALEKAHVVDDARLVEAARDLNPGYAALVHKRFVISAHGGLVELLQVRPEGKKSMEGAAFAAGIQGLKSKQVRWSRPEPASARL